MQLTWAGLVKKNEDEIEDTRQNLIPLSRQYMTLADAQEDIANIPDGSATYVRSTDGSSLADEYINNGGTLEATGRVMPSQGYVDVTISESIDKNDDSNLSKSITSDGITTELETESGEKFFSGMNESLQEMASRSWKDNTSNLHSATDKYGVQLVITDAEGKISIPLSDFPLQDLLAQVQPVSGPFLNTLSSADKAAYGYIDELGGLNLPGIPTSVNNMLNSLSRRVQQQADSRF
ncbi:hypothetical protein QUH01_23265, partial [Klebsiella michiganensis]|nr:hypothetical protein [Klebsiella michiganensis]MDM6925750.1 hypothetical protein [Klebsiella michiganensis]MDM7027254.1 hypothetical protein [Klebsiella michiganensis]MDM7033073.1 hypothetical protein [Klebsiella michiganensis]